MQTPKEIAAGGILAYANIGRELLFLLLRNAETKNWEPPKGLIEKGESLIKGALREFVEETGLLRYKFSNDLGSPYRFHHMVNEKCVKITYLFPMEIAISDINNIILSKEHTEYKWASLQQLRMLIKFENIACIYEEFNHSQKTFLNNSEVHRLRRESILDKLNFYLEKSNTLRNFDWFIGGSFSAGEETWHNEKLVSDIDLVAVSPDGLKPQNFRRSLNNLQANIFESLYQQANKISGCLLRPGQLVNTSELFWSYFSKSATLIGPRKYESLTFVNDSSHIQRLKIYEFYRLIWYHNINKMVYPKTVETHGYNDLKTICLCAAIVSSIGNSKFVSYSSTYSNILEMASGAPENERLFFAALEAIDCKLNRRGMQQHGHQKETMKDWLIYTYGKLHDDDYDAYFIAAYSLSLLHGEPSVPEELFPHIKKVLGEKHMLALKEAESANNQYMVVLLLSIYRLKRWPVQTQWSSWRYQKYLAILEEKALLHKTQFSNSWVRDHWIADQQRNAFAI